jgi:A/G-specific adenine glycosylase
MQTGKGSVWTNALIDLGATACLPRIPKCGDCPLSFVCVAQLRGQQLRYGRPHAKPVRKTVDVACGIIRRADGRILIAQRPETGLLPNLWEFPGGKREGREALVVTCQREIKEELGIDVEVGLRRMVIAHGYSHYAVRLHVFECRYRMGRPRAIGCQQFRWVKAAELGKLAFPAANKRIIAEIVTGPG